MAETDWKYVQRNKTNGQYRTTDEGGGGGSSTLAGLTDVNLSSPSDGQILKYDAENDEWVNDDESGGTVTDVNVNGESVVDSNGKAQIVSYKEVTLAEYMALPDTKINDGVMYCIKDIGGANQFPPLIYSDEEREVGVWRDGKPLYQKTISFGALPNSSGKDVPHGISNLEYIVYAVASASNNDYSSQRPIPYTHFNNAGNQAMMNYNQTNVHIQCSGNQSEYTKTFVTLFYTKTTDTPGSGTWTTQGGYAHHYSTSEKVIGTWIDGKPIYERVITLASTTSVSAGTWKTIYTDSFIGTIGQMIKCVYIVTANGGVYTSMLYKPDGNNLQSYVYSGTATFSSPNKLVIQYTKNTD